MENEETVRIENLYKDFGKKKVLKDINLHINGGETAIILGESGSGKTVLVRHINGVYRPTSGRVYVFNQDLSELKGIELERFRRRVGYVYQNNALFESLSVRENIGLVLKEQYKIDMGRIDNSIGEKIQEKVRQCARDVGLKGEDLDKRPYEISGGMRKRVALARTMACISELLEYQPEIIIFDEPTAGLDPIKCKEVCDLVISTKLKTKGTYIVVTHDLDMAFLLGDRVFMIEEGKEIFNGNIQSFLNSKREEVGTFLTVRKKTPAEMLEINHQVKSGDRKLEEVLEDPSFRELGQIKVA